MFDLNISDKQIETTQKPAKPKTSEKQKLIKKEKTLLRKEVAKEIIQSIGGWPKVNESVDVITNGQSNAGGFYETAKEEFKGIEKLCLATWMINRHYIDMLIEDINTGRLKSLVFILSNRMSQLGGGHKANYSRIKSIFPDMENIQFRVCHSHAKVYALKTAGNHFVVSGSGNWSENPRIENYIIQNSKTSFEFHEKWMTEQAKI